MTTTTKFRSRSRRSIIILKKPNPPLQTLQTLHLTPTTPLHYHSHSTREGANRERQGSRKDGTRPSPPEEPRNHRDQLFTQKLLLNHAPKPPNPGSQGSVGPIYPELNLNHLPEHLPPAPKPHTKNPNGWNEPPPALPLQDHEISPVNTMTQSLSPFTETTIKRNSYLTTNTQTPP